MKTVIFEFQPTPEQPPWLPAAGRRDAACAIPISTCMTPWIARSSPSATTIRPDTCWTRTRTGARSCCGATGVMLVLSEDGGWVVPPQRRLDPGRRHAPGADAGVSTRTSSRARRGRAGLRSGGGVAAVAPAAAGGRGHAGAVRQGRARRRAGPTAAARGGPRAGAAAAHPLPRDARLGRARPSWRRRTSARGRRTGPGGCT